MRGSKGGIVHLQALAGNPGKRTRKESSAGKPLMDTRPPRRLRGVARDTWNRLAPQLLEDQLLTELSREHLVAYCDAVALYEHMSEIVDDLIAKKQPLVANTPNGGKQQIPEVGMRNRALEQILKFGEILAVDPYTRERRGKGAPDKPGPGDSARLLTPAGS